MMGSPPKEKAAFNDFDVQKLWNSLDIEYVDAILILLHIDYRSGELFALTNDKINIRNWTI